VGGKRLLIVFVCIQEDMSGDSTALEQATWNVRVRLLSAARGQRNLSGSGCSSWR
jgi:hypothetical protein